MSTTNFSTSLKTYSIFVFIITFIVYVCIFFNLNNFMQINRLPKQTKVNAFIVTMNCSSARFNFTQQNIHRVFPNFFTIYCIKPVSLNDSRIDQSASLLDKKLASNLITFANLWTYEIPKYATNDELEWSFIFEDDVNFIEPSHVSLPNYINAIQELMYHPEVQLKDGVLYLGICGPLFATNKEIIKTSFSNGTLLSHKAFGSCVHAMGLTTKRARSFWTEISLYCPIPNGPADVYIRQYCVRSGNRFYILGANIHWPPFTGHHGIAYQDRERFRSEIW